MNADLSFNPAIPVAESTSETDELIYRISHDLRASVRALQELPSWILEDLEKSAIVLPPPTARHMELISDHACRLDLMLIGLLEYSRVGRMQRISAIKPADVLAEVIDDSAFPDGIHLTTNVDRGSIQMGDVDLHRVFSILLTNAVRFHSEHLPRIAVTAGPISDRVWQITVADDGPGIPADKREFVLQPMTKLVSRDVDPGAGMGLAILSKIAFTYGGEVEIGVPKSGKGTVVRITLAVN